MLYGAQRFSIFLCHCEERSDAAICPSEWTACKGYGLPRPRWGLAMTGDVIWCAKILYLPLSLRGAKPRGPQGEALFGCCAIQGGPWGCLLRQDIRPCWNQKTPSFRMEFSVLALPIFPCSHPQSIVGEGVLNFCVRDGNRWTHTPINTNFISFEHSVVP